ncbi:30372_t:CDS:2, partial [Racocetra persica]
MPTAISRKKINKTLTDLEQEPNPNDKEEEMTTNENENQNPLSDLEKELIKSFFHKYKIKKISLHNDSLSKIDKNELTAQEL